MNIPMPILVAILGFAFSVIIGVTSFFVKAMNNSTKAITDIRLWMAEKFMTKSCITNHSNINRKFNDQGKRIDNHEKRLTTLEENK